METSEYLDAVRTNAGLLIDAVKQAGLEARVPTCPDWTVADLARHQGRVYHWVATIVGEKAQAYVDRKQLAEQAERAEPLTWLEGGAGKILELFAQTDPETPVWNWIDGGAGPARFWFRRMAHETVIHRVDGESATAGRINRVDPPELASDGIDEFLQFLPIKAAGGERFGSVQGSYHFHTTDVSGEWMVVFDGDGVTIRREHAKADIAIRGAASDLELFLYNRGGRDGLEIFGDEAGVAAWTEHVRF
ncbi:MAG: maleylpyruvate isomerase N-terminal domain-containing protein [Actinobacteria bacterium]|nr:maleylpyruvate isomerase N-terminal domain-containing protein [Actinomycetota bacterium]